MNRPLLHAPTNDVRCETCSALLARQRAGCVVIRRSGLVVEVTGRDATLQLTCYRCQAPRIIRARRELDGLAAPR